MPIRQQTLNATSARKHGGDLVADRPLTHTCVVRHGRWLWHGYNTQTGSSSLNLTTTTENLSPALNVRGPVIFGMSPVILDWRQNGPFGGRVLCRERRDYHHPQFLRE